MFSGLQDDGWPSALITLIASPVTQSHLALITCCLIQASLHHCVCLISLAQMMRVLCLSSGYFIHCAQQEARRTKERRTA